MSLKFPPVEKLFSPSAVQRNLRSSAKELKGTDVVRVSMDEVSAKIRSGPPVDDEPDYELDVWAGVLPLEQSWGAPVADPKLSAGIEESDSVKKLKR